MIIAFISIKKRTAALISTTALRHMLVFSIFCLYILLLLYIWELHDESVLQHMSEAFDISTQLFDSAFHTDQKVRADEHGKTVVGCCGEQFVNVPGDSSF